MFLVLFLIVLVLYQICSARPCILLCTSINKKKNRKNIHWERLVSTGIFFLHIAKELQFSKSEQTFNHRWLLTSPITLRLHGHNTIKLFAKCLEVFGRCRKCYTIKTSIHQLRLGLCPTNRNSDGLLRKRPWLKGWELETHRSQPTTVVTRFV